MNPPEGPSEPAVGTAVCISRGGEGATCCIIESFPCCFVPIQYSPCHLQSETRSETREDQPLRTASIETTNSAAAYHPRTSFARRVRLCLERRNGAFPRCQSGGSRATRRSGFCRCRCCRSAPDRSQWPAARADAVREGSTACAGWTEAWGFPWTAALDHRRQFAGERQQQRSGRLDAGTLVDVSSGCGRAGAPTAALSIGPIRCALLAEELGRRTLGGPAVGNAETVEQNQVGRDCTRMLDRRLVPRRTNVCRERLRQSRRPEWNR